MSVPSVALGRGLVNYPRPSFRLRSLYSSLVVKSYCWLAPIDFQQEMYSVLAGFRGNESLRGDGAVRSPR